MGYAAARSMWRALSFSFFFAPLALVLFAGCPDRTAMVSDRGSRTATAPDKAPALIAIREGAGLLYSFFDQRAELRTVERLDKVLPSARGEVQVTDPGRPAPGDTVFLADLRKPGKDGRYRVWLDRRGAWLDRVMPRVSQLRKPLLASAEAPVKKAPKVHKKRRRPRPRAELASSGPTAPEVEAPQAPRPRVLLFSTAWCPSCKAARAHLNRRGIRFAELDVEKDQQAAMYYQKLAAAHRLKPGVVPLIVVDGRPMQGFSAAQLDAVLAASGLASNQGVR